jgi:cytochrome o ubiquinol oxidase subunit IV
MIDQSHHWNISFKPPILGYVFSLILTISAFRLSAEYQLTTTIAFVIFGLALAQGFLQLIFFLFLGLESKPHWNTITFLFMLLVLAIIVAGTIWIMHHLNYNMMPMPPMAH